MSEENTQRGAGGTPGGIGEFIIGFIMIVGGGYLILNQVTVTSGYWFFWGYNAFGLTLIPLLFGVGILFFNYRSIIGWVLTVAGTVIIFAGIITHLDIYFRPTSLFNTLLMFVLFIGGFGAMARSFRSH